MREASDTILAGFSGASDKGCLEKTRSGRDDRFVNEEGHSVFAHENLYGLSCET